MIDRLHHAFLQSDWIVEIPLTDTTFDTADTSTEMRRNGAANKQSTWVGLQDRIPKNKDIHFNV